MDPIKVVGSMVLVLLVIVVVGVWFRGSVDAAQKSLNPIETSSRNSLCGATGQQLLLRGELKETIEGEKGDGFPDDCDNCLGGDNKKVSNSYGIPDDCYMAPTKDNKIKTYKDMCGKVGGCYIFEAEQCCKLESCRAKCR